ncbi:hypothetical protein FS749_004436 [Ceratobasidium sp. UAMH 11750]|nr:hypothetical protein FS749_004436 [Ceratobasidium sp. UAMH 11750]
MNQFIEHYLQAYVNYKQDDWARWLPLAEFAYNSSNHSATGKSLFFTLYGYHLAFTPKGDTQTSIPAAQDHAKEIAKIHTKVRSSLEQSKQKMIDPLLSWPTYKPGEKVWLNAKNIQQDRPSLKLSHIWIGPYEVLERISNAAYHLKLPKSLKIHNMSLKEGDNIQEVKKIVNGWQRQNKWEFLIKWKGFGPEDNE